MDRRLLGNILIITLLILLGSGMVMYFKPFSRNIASLHTFFGFLFVLGMTLHILNNKIPLSNYITGKRQSKLKKLQSPLVFFITLLLALGLYLDAPILKNVYSFGNELRNKQLGKSEELFDYQVIELKEVLGRHTIDIELKKGPYFQYPLFAIWLEDSSGNYLETLYISRVISSSSFDYGKKIDDKWEPAIIRRPEALPYWSHKRGIKASDGLYVPLNNTQDIDAVSGATPTGNFIIKSKSNLKNLNDFKVMLEVNQSFDWNDYYTKDKFPDDAIYSGSGQVGQPSLIYEATIERDINQQSQYQLMHLVGHGHYSGKNGKLFKDLSLITTAKEIVDRVILKIN